LIILYFILRWIFVYRKEKPGDLLREVQGALDSNKPLHIVAEMCLRLAQKLKLEEDEEWLSKEVYGFEELLKKENQEKGMKMRKADDKYSYRTIGTEFNLQVRGGKIQPFPLKVLMTKPLSQIERLVKNFNQNPSSTKELIMWGVPLEILVETFKISSREKIPYPLNISELENILHEVRKKILRFLEKVHKK